MYLSEQCCDVKQMFLSSKYFRSKQNEKLQWTWIRLNICQKAKTLCYFSSIYSPLLISLGICNYFIDSLPSNTIILSQNWKEISFNLFLHFLVPDSGILKLAVRLKKKDQDNHFFLYFRGAVSRGTSPLDSPNSMLYEPDHLIKNIQNLTIRTKTKI